LLVLPCTVRAAENQYQDAPPDRPIDGRRHPSEKQFEEEAEPEEPGPFTEALRHAAQRWPHFLGESRLDVRFRSYYLYGKLKDNSRREAWTYGGWIRWSSGWWRERVKLTTALHISQPIHAPSDRDGTELLRLRQRPFSVFGESHATLRLAEGHTVRLYRQLYDLPYINKDDGKMAPNTFEGYSIQGDFPRSGRRPGIRYLAGWISRMKPRDSDRFISMGEQAGAIGDPKRGLAMAGLLFHLSPETSVGALHYHVPDVLNIFYTAADWKHRVSDALGVRAQLQYTDQRSTGDDLLTGSSFDTHQVAGLVGVSYRGATLTFAMSTTSDEEDLRSPYGAPPSPLSRMLYDFDRADEDAWDVGLVYDFSGVGLPGLTIFGHYARGSDARDATTGAKLPDQYELDLTADYRLQRGRLRGFWIRVRGAFVRERDGGETQNELRVIFNYDIPVLGPTKVGPRRSAERFGTKTRAWNRFGGGIGREALVWRP
jgi:hypothetical protein